MMIQARHLPLAISTAGRRGMVLAHRCQRQHQRYSTAAAAPASPSRKSRDKPPPAVGHEPDEELLQLEDEYSTLKVNWFPGHMVKATKVIREKLKQVCDVMLTPTALLMAAPFVRVRAYPQAAAETAPVPPPSAVAALLPLQLY